MPTTPVLDMDRGRDRRYVFQRDKLLQKITLWFKSRHDTNFLSAFLAGAVEGYLKSGNRVILFKGVR